MANRSAVVLGDLDGEFYVVDMKMAEKFVVDVNHMQSVIFDCVKLGTVEPEWGTAPVVALVLSNFRLSKDEAHDRAMEYFQETIDAVT